MQGAKKTFKKDVGKGDNNKKDATICYKCKKSGQINQIVHTSKIQEKNQREEPCSKHGKKLMKAVPKMIVT